MYTFSLLRANISRWIFIDFILFSFIVGENDNKQNEIYEE